MNRRVNSGSLALILSGTLMAVLLAGCDYYWAKASVINHSGQSIRFGVLREATVEAPVEWLWDTLDDGVDFAVSERFPGEIPTPPLVALAISIEDSTYTLTKEDFDSVGGGIGAVILVLESGPRLMSSDQYRRNWLHKYLDRLLPATTGIRT